MVSSIGDLFLRDNEDKIYWLNVGEGQLTKVADRISEFQEKLQDKEQVSELRIEDKEFQVKDNEIVSRS